MTKKRKKQPTPVNFTGFGQRQQHTLLSVLSLSLSPKGVFCHFQKKGLMDRAEVYVQD